MKNKIIGLFMLGVFVFAVGAVSAASTATTIVNVDVKPAEISFSVPEEINFGSLTQGYKSNEIGFYVNNTGETDIRVEADLDSSYSGDIFQNLKFRKNNTVTSRTLASFYLTIKKPDNVNESVSQYAYTWLDLSKYTGEITETTHDETNLIFTAMPN